MKILRAGEVGYVLIDNKRYYATIVDPKPYREYIVVVVKNYGYEYDGTPMLISRSQFIPITENF